MNAQERHILREEIAKGINHGLSNIDIQWTLGKYTYSPADLIGVIRDLMEEPSNDAT